MSEPKTVAKTVDEVVPGLFHYQIQDERIHHISDGHILVEGGSLTLIDPVRIDETALKRLGTVGAIVIDNSSHQRSAWHYRKQTKAGVHAPQDLEGLDEAPDATFRDRDRLPGGMRAIHAPGPGEHHYAFLVERGPGVLICGDLFIHDPGKEIAFLPDKYLEDPAKARDSATRLLDQKFEILCFGHGAPLTKGARTAIKDLLERDRKTSPKH
jgi:Metallo-beta-lactamase superfamily